MMKQSLRWQQDKTKDKINNPAWCPSPRYPIKQSERDDENDWETETFWILHFPCSVARCNLLRPDQWISPILIGGKDDLIFALAPQPTAPIPGLDWRTIFSPDSFVDCITISVFFHNRPIRSVAQFKCLRQRKPFNISCKIQKLAERPSHHFADTM